MRNHSDPMSFKTFDLPPPEAAPDDHDEGHFLMAAHNGGGGGSQPSLAAFATYPLQFAQHDRDARPAPNAAHLLVGAPYPLA